MPYMLEGNCVYKENADGSKGKLVKCHGSAEEAKAHLRALYANVEEGLASFSMFITKSTNADGMMRWSAVNSDTEWDLYGEKMTLQLYKSMLGKIERKEPPPPDFSKMVCSDYWCGGMPYVSLAHYPDLNGKAVPGEPTHLYIDGTQLKAKGMLFDTPLGRAVWKSLKQDEIEIKKSKDAQRIRISIAFLDLAHKHGDGGAVFYRKSRTSVCQECKKGIGNKIYLDGYLVHLALTRVPVNPRTVMEAEDVMTKKSKITTKKEDALSIVQDSELVDAIDTASMEMKSDVLVEMSQTEEEGQDKEDKMGDEQAKNSLVEDSKTKDSPAEDESAPDDEEEDKKEMEECSLTAKDIETIRSLIAEALPKVELSAVAETPVAVETVVAQKSALDLATDQLYNAVNSAVTLEGTLEQKLESINPSLQNLGKEITALVKDSMGVSEVQPVSNDQSMVLEAVTSLANTVKALTDKIALLEQKSTVVEQPVSRTPVPRSVPPTAVAQKSQTEQSNPNSVANIVRRSVSSTLPPK